MTPFYFGPSGRRLFGLWQPAEVAPRGAALLVRPFGHEVVRTHRLYRVLADRLARQGWHVLRFDAFGSGDSDGDDAELRLAGWAADIVAAQAELLRRAGALPVAWLASRLGATAALLACTAARPQPHLVLWDTVVDGAAYLADLRLRHVQALEASYSVADPAWRRQLADPEAFAGEAIGFAIDPALRGEVLALRPDTLPWPTGARPVLVSSPGNRHAAEWAARHGGPAAHLVLERDFEWTSDDSLNTALVPADALNALLKAADGP